MNRTIHINLRSNMHQNSNSIQSKVVVIRRKPNQGFGFTLRHFIAYPPEDEETWPETSDSYQRKPMETIFIKEVQPNGPASFAGLQTGDRVLMVNNMLIAGITYSKIVSMIKQTPTVLLLHVVPKECDILQMSYDIAHTPESNRLSKVPANLPSISAQNSLHHRMISYPANSMRTIQKRDNDEYNHVGPGSLILRNDNGILRTKPSNITVLSRPNADYDFMVRLRKSIEQKEEFLKSPVPHPQTTFFQQSMPARGQVSNALMKPLPQDLLPASCDMKNFYAKNLPVAFSSIGTFNSNRKSSIEITQTTPMSTRNHQNYANSSSLSVSSGSSNSSSNSIKEKFHKELEFLETLPELGVTNQVFERKLVSHLAKGFDPFKPLSINTTSDVEKSPAQIKALHKTKSAGSTIDEYQLPVESSSQTEESINEDKSSISKSESNDEAKSMPTSTEVVRRYKPIIIDDNKPMRRISYLRATNSENEYHLETSTDTSNIEKKNKRASVQQELDEGINIEEIIEINGKAESKEEIKAEVEIFETEMEVKSSCIFGKRMSDYRSWRQVKIVLKGDILKIYPPGRGSKSDNNVIELDVRNFNILDESVDKKKYVFRLQSKPRIITNTLLNDDFRLSAQLTTMNNDILNNEKFYNDYTEIVFKTKSITEMKKLFGVLQEKCNLCSVYNSSDNNLLGKQQAEPQKTAAIASMPTSNSYCDDNVQDYSPQSSTSRGDIETESISPVMKTRKSHYKNIPEKDLGSPKTKNWKDLLFRRHHGNSADISPWNLASTSKTIGSIGVPLRSCPVSKENEFVPNIVEVCTNIVETKGLTVVGIYRIPGNKAAISELKEQVNKSDFCWDRVNTDVRWEDVNVVSSLLKLFIRSLPDALLPSSFYINFIEADKKSGDRRLKELKHLLHSLPQISYETMKHILRHLSRVSKNCDVNLMEPKNLAIIFGPSIIRTPNDTLEIAVKDMKHQCRIVELLLTQYEYFFEDGELPELECYSAPLTSSTCTSHQDQTSLLLDNVSKIEQRLHDRDESKTLTSRLIPHLRRRTHSKRSSDTYSGESVLSLDYKKSPDAPIKDNNQKIKEIAILLTDDESSNSRISDSGSMSLTTITDTLDTKLRNLRSGSESNDENGSPNKQSSIANRRNTFQQPLILHENIPYADESPERSMLPDNSTLNHLKNFPSRNSAFIRDITRNPRFSSVYESCSDDSEVSTTSDPKESSIMTPLFLELYKKRRDYRLFRSASFNCRNYSSRGGGNGYHNSSALTKDEKTDMNLTKKRQIQNKQNNIKRRHTVGGPHDYSSTATRRTNTTNGNSNDHGLEVGVRIKNVNRRN